MSNLDQTMQRLVKQLTKLPGVGTKSARRMAYHILEQDDAWVEGITEAMLDAKKRIHHCSICYNYTESDPCPICSNGERDHGVICVVSYPKDVYLMEKAGPFHGVYHVLGSEVSPLDDRGPDQLRLKELLDRVNQDTKEVIIATNPTLEGETTARYVARVLAATGVPITRIAQGMPAGGNMEYFDESTISMAMNHRIPYQA